MRCEFREQPKIESEHLCTAARWRAEGGIAGVICVKGIVMNCFGYRACWRVPEECRGESGERRGPLGKG